jgi:hypothetical protein
LSAVIIAALHHTNRRNNGSDKIAGTVKVYSPVLFQVIRSFIGIAETSYLQCLDLEKEGMWCPADSDSASG